MGHVCFGLGMAWGVGASISASLAGVIVVNTGYSTAFVRLPACGLVFYLVAMPETRGYEPPTDHRAIPAPAMTGERAA